MRFGERKRLVERVEIAAKLALGAEDERADRRKLAIENAGDLRIAHVLVIAEEERDAVLLRKVGEQLAETAAALVEKDLGERGKSGAVHKGIEDFSFEAVVFFAAALAELVNAMPASDLGNPGAKGERGVLLRKDGVELEEDFGGGILGVLRLAEKAAADAKDVVIVDGVNGRDDLRTSVEGAVEGKAEGGILEEHRAGNSGHAVYPP